VNGRIKVAEMFCGIGGFRLGLERANLALAEQEGRGGPRRHGTEPPGERWHGHKEETLRCVWANDIDRHACQVYRKRWNDGTLVEGDIRAVDASSIPDHELLTAGFPCQSFSVAGKRKGFADTRGTLFFEIARVLEHKKPQYLLLENVEGLLSHSNGQTFQKVLEVLSDLGYLLQWQVLNSRDFGVPQNRKRVFIVGHLGGQPRPQVFPVGEVGEVSSREANSEPESGEASALEASYEKTKNLSNMIDTTGALTGGGHSGGLHSQMTMIYDGHHKQFTEKMGTLTGRENRQGTNWLIAGNTKIRRLTPTECERLQGFPDGWTATGITAEGEPVGISDTQRYKMLGNAVTVNVIESLGRRLLEAGW